jgi:putative spermidine/putrescine transport system substrate-binding protein
MGRLIRQSIVILCVVAAATVGKTDGFAADKLIIVGWGGSYQEAQRKALFEPFQKESGIQVVEDTGPQIQRSKAEVESGRPSYDLTVTSQAFYMIGLDQNLWEPIDYKYFDPADLKALPEESRLKYGVGHIYYTEGMAFNTQAFPSGKPQPNSWADFWDVRKFPGKRALPMCDVASYPIPEAALLADGVLVDKLYPIDIPRVIKKVRELMPHVIWWKDIQQPGQLLASGEAVIAMAPNGRVQQLADKGAPVQVVWNQGRYTFDVWYVLRGAAHKDAAMRFIAFASRPDRQAEMAKLSGLAPTHPGAYKFLDAATARKLPTYPENFRQTFQKSEQWWKATRQQWIEACTAGVLTKP